MQQMQVLVGIVLPFALAALTGRYRPSFADACQRLFARRTTLIVYLSNGFLIGSFVSLFGLAAASSALFNTYRAPVAVLMAAAALCWCSAMVSFVTAHSDSRPWFPVMPTVVVAAAAVCVGCVVWAIAIAVREAIGR